MAAPTEDLISFDLIESSKENIKVLPCGRSAKALASILSPRGPSAAPLASPSHTEDLNSAIRAEYEAELLHITDSDDPLDIYDRYIRWTLDAYPSASATPASGLLALLERATKHFISDPVYANDPRYLKIWLHYIRLFSDAPRETFAFLARHHIGEALALYYEEFAAWLEGQGRWTQAEEVYEMGLQKEARPRERLSRKFGEFQRRYHVALTEGTAGEAHRSPALEPLRPALALKVNPFGSTVGEAANPQARDRARAAAGGGAKKLGKPKLAVFADGDEVDKPGSSGSAKGWESIQSLAERKKENTIAAKPWAGETIKGMKRNGGAEKMMVFKDETVQNDMVEQAPRPHPLRAELQSVNPKTGRTEHVFVNLEMVYPDASDPAAAEFCFEELRARHRGWLEHDWAAIRREEEARKQQVIEEAEAAERAKLEAKVRSKGAAAVLSQELQKLALNDENDENAPPSQEEIEKARLAKQRRREERANRTRKIRVMEVRGETQTVQTNLASPTGRKLRRKKSAEPTMTFHTREAMEEIYGIFSQPLSSSQEKEDVESAAESDDGDYTSGGESTGTGRISGTTSDYGEETEAGDFTEMKSTVGDDEVVTESGTQWSEFTANKQVPEEEQAHTTEDQTTGQTQETAWEIYRDEQEDSPPEQEELVTPVFPDAPSAQLPTQYVPLPPEHYDVPTRPYRDPAIMANNRLPFMTPIVEKTESSMGAATALAEKDYFTSKTPCRKNGTKTPTIPEIDGEVWSSPFQDVLEEASKLQDSKIPQPALSKALQPKVPLGVSKGSKPQAGSLVKETAQKGPIIKDVQCNPVDEDIRQTILSQIQPPLMSYDGYHEDRHRAYGRSAELRRFAKAVSKTSKNTADKTATNLSMPPTLAFSSGERRYTIKRELGKGAFAPVYLAESDPAHDADDEDENAPAQMGKGTFGVRRNRLEAIKMEDPPSAWEFYIIRQAKRRLGVSRAADSIIQAYEMRLFQDECYLVEEYRDQGTLLNLVNIAKADVSGGGVLDELMAMFFTVELLRTTEALHAKGLIHGDLKADNVLVRLDEEASWSSQYHRDGMNGWAAKGITLIDFGRGIDMKVFRPDVQFIADWKTSEADCAEMREMRPWTFQVDYHGLAGIVHNLLFGKYIETVAERGAALGAGATKTYRIRESFKRYWQTEIWEGVMDLLLNPLMHLEGEEGRKLPVLKGMRNIRERMEDYLESNCEKGVGLKGLLRRMEEKVRDRKR
ncbi:protein kinase [Coniosporium tulheliwenetii]|uniref:Protein kinase n=1 Tax=Coniosporium tulheliwenetii TaxID=3383036 RepID=A0ACC2ZME6_9PEZI|nr:protein kinase [Cladosporium sp. JES 115]